ncbi:MAG: 16S rRNA (cytosine(1402)-N(4))-methyltransferase RsmH [Clostridia bacterium]|nr:16S rRNA (cytosine(1402)-N(4))-methyltransferase RsmH [Clostridia bacterium]
MEDREALFSHTPVLLRECIDGLNVQSGLTYVDCTTGGGGHSFEIARRLGPTGRLICLDRDADALSAARKRLSTFLDRITFVHVNFSEIAAVLAEYRIDNLGGVLMDLGCSAFQQTEASRGLSYMKDAPLDMRMNREETLTARDVVNDYPPEKLLKIIDTYGEERFASSIVSAIVRQRQIKPIETTAELSDVICSAIPVKFRVTGHHPAKKTFQAIRIEVNRELDAISPAIRGAADNLVEGGKLVIISFQSGEDKIVKNTLNELANPCICPRDFPVCVCGRKPIVRIETKKPILPTEKELAENPRSRSAKLRIATRLPVQATEKRGEPT